MQIEYEGRIGKRGDPVMEDYVMIPGYSSIDTTIQLAEFFFMEQGSLYEVQLAIEIEDYAWIRRALPHLRDGFTPMAIVSNRIIVNGTTLIPPVLPFLPDRLGISYKSCTASQQTTVSSAWTLFTQMRSRMSTQIAKGSTTLYTTWFGAYTASRWNTASGTITKINGLSTAIFDCGASGCSSSSVFAYVYPTDSTHTIYLCNQFWKSGTTGYDTQPGTIVHESSHFNDIGGTQDHAYGTTAAKNLASSNPAQAVKNADNYEYFGESS